MHYERYESTNESQKMNRPADQREPLLCELGISLETLYSLSKTTAKNPVQP